MRARNGSSWSGTVELTLTKGRRDGQVCRCRRASEKHDGLLCDDEGEELLATTFADDEALLRMLCRALVCPKAERVAVERPDPVPARLVGQIPSRLRSGGLRVARQPSEV
jgi:hypothetical protein